jgi:hypothetical protein
MFQRKKKKIGGKVVSVIDATRAPYTQYGIGPKRGNPRLCLECGQPIKRGETWRRDASAEDPDGYGRIVTIRHSPRCPDQRARDTLQIQRR